MHILIAEDDPLIARFLAEGLEGEGHRAHVLADGEAALAEARRDRWDLILLDWLLPGRDGPSICRALRAEGQRTPVIMLTARDAVLDRVEGLDSGADDYLTKPFAFDELFARMRSVTRRGGAGGTPVLAAGDLRLDPAGHRVTRGGAEVRLTPKEFALLEYLMRRAPRVCPRPELLRGVWGYAHDPGTNIVDVYVGYLRRKVDRSFSVPLIHTIPGVGYRVGE